MRNTNTVSKREWTTPELKKVDLKQVTAHGANKNQHDAATRS
jgi:hypothetical protein